MNEKLLGVIGDPIEHSLSPALFEFVLRKLELPYDYQAFHIRANELSGFLQRAYLEGILGLNVTIPHKERVIPLLDGLDPQAARMGAVNTIANERGQLIGYNTDALGFLRSLQDGEIQLEGKRAVVLGAGGAAKAVIFALIDSRVREIVLVNRTLSRVEELATRAVAKTGYQAMRCLKLHDPQLSEVISQAMLLVNATPVGMYPESDACPLSDLSCLHSGLIVYDLIYNPLQTQLLNEAKKRGAQVISGLDMLIYQGLESLRIWVKEKVQFPEKLIQEVRSHLETRLRSQS